MSSRGKPPGIQRRAMRLAWVVSLGTVLLGIVLSGIGGCGGDPVARWAAELQDEDVHVRRAAARQLADLGFEAEPAASALGNALDDPDREVRRLAIHAVSQVGPPAESFLPALQNALDDEELSVRIAAAIAINRIDPNEEGHQRVLIDAMKMGEGGIIVTVGQMAEDAGWAVPTLIDLLGDPRPGIRRISANSLEQIGPAAAAAEETLQQVASSDAEERVREAAQQALDRMNLDSSRDAAD